jgi:hypothetical protein
MRCWIGGDYLRFCENGSHVDEHGAHGVFQAFGTLSEMESLAQSIATGLKLRRFEERLYVVWV